MVVNKAVAGGRRLVVGVTVGASAYSLLRGQLAWFREQGWDVTLVSSPDDQARQAATREGVELEAIPMHRGISPIKDLVALGRWIRLVAGKKPEAVNVGTPKAGLLGVVAAWICRVPKRLYVVRGLRLEGSRGPVGLLLWIMEWITMKLATDVLFVSRSLASEVTSRGLGNGRESWLIGAGSSNGVDAEAVARRVSQVERSDVRADLGIDAGAFVVGFIGRLSSDKGIDTLLTACADASLDSRVEFLLIGSLEEPALQEALTAQAERIRRVPWTEDVWGHLPAMDVLCLPTRREGFPNVVLEAAAAGVPTITTTATGAVDSVLPGETGLLMDVDAPEELVSQINTLAQSEVTRLALGLTARERVFEQFKPEDVWEGIAEILNDEPQTVRARRIGQRSTKGAEA